MQDSVSVDHPSARHFDPFLQPGEATLAIHHRRYIGEVTVRTMGTQELGAVLDLPKESLPGDAHSVTALDGDVAAPGDSLLQFINFFQRH
jgi:hypothetical protein